MNDNETLKILLDALTGTLSDLSSKFERVVGSQDRLENHLSSIDKTMTAQTNAITTSRENIELIRKDLNAALETVKAVERQLQGDGRLDDGIRGDLKALKEKATTELDNLKEKIDGSGKEDADGKTDIGIHGDVKFIRANMGWVSRLSEWIRKPGVIVSILIGVIIVVAGIKQGWDAFKDPFISHQAVPPSIPLNIKVKASNNFVTLEWAPSTGKDSPIAWYRVLRNGDLLSVAPTTTFIDDHVASNTVYCYSLQAVDSSGQISQTSPLQCVTPGK